MAARPHQYPPQHSDDEIQRIRRVFQDVDGWVEHDSGYVLGVAFRQNRATDRTFVGLDVSKEFYRVLYDDDEGKPPFDDFDAVIALFCDNTKASYLYYRFKFMVSYLEAGPGVANVGTFIQAIRNDVPSHWEVVPQNEQVKTAWQLLWIILNLRSETDRQTNITFKGQIDIFFPPSPNGPTSFSINLNDLENVDLRVKPTRNFHEHLLIEGDTVNIYQLHNGDIKLMLNYEKNKAAKALGIAGLGDEIRASLYALYGKDELHTKAGALDIFKPDLSEQLGLLCARFLELSADTQPAVLAYKVHTLQKLVDGRRSWWPSLVRDLRKQYQTQPLYFYGAIFAIFFGVCTVIQTVTSVWSLVTK